MQDYNPGCYGGQRRKIVSSLPSKTKEFTAWARQSLSENLKREEGASETVGGSGVGYV